MNKSLDLAARSTDQWIEDLKTCLRIPSISTKPEHKQDVQECAQWIVDHLRGMGLGGVRVQSTDKHPIITGEHIVDPNLPTVLVYGHYDVQPAEPLELWTTPAFEPDVRDGILYARGAVDDKGQLFMVIKAIEACLASGDGLPVNLKFAIEGEEESGSESLPPFLVAHAKEIAADVLLVCDTTMVDAKTPTITTSLRGMTYLQVDLEGAKGDLHSGAFGGAVANVLRVLGELIASFHDDDNRVAVAGFYDGVAEPTQRDRDEVAAVPFTMDSWSHSSGESTPRVETGYTIAEATALRPCLDVNGVWGGYQGDGAKTVIPGEAGFKVSARLVAGQTPEDITKKITAHVHAHIPQGIRAQVTPLGDGSPFAAATDSPAISAASRALEAAMGKPPVMLRGGGSIPAVAMFSDALGVDAAMIGFGLKSDNVHAPDEHFGIDRFEMGVQTIIRFFHEFATSQR